MDYWLKIVGVLICLFFSAFFSSTETAFTSFNKAKMKALAADGNKKATAVLKMSDNYDKLLSTILVGNNIVNISMSSIATLLFIDLLAGGSLAQYAAAISTAVITVTVLIFGEISPKSLAKDHAEGFALAVCRPLQFFCLILTPVNALFMLWKKLLTKIFKAKNIDTVTESEVLILVDEAHEDGSIDEYNKELIENIFDFDDLTAVKAATHRRDLVTLSTEDSIDDWADTVLNSRFSRYPVCGESTDDIIGILDARAFLRVYEDGRDAVMQHAVRPAYFVPESVKLDVLFRKMKEAKECFAVVLDEHGGTSGVITLTDLVECLVGDFSGVEDEEVEDPEFLQLGDSTWLVRGDALISDVNRKTGSSMDEDEADTLSGYLLGVRGEIPEDGTTFEMETDNITVKVLQIKDRTIERVELCVKATDEDEDEEKESEEKDPALTGN